MYIDKITYNKAKHIPYHSDKACGYQPRPTGRLQIQSELVHTTNGKRGSTLAQEAKYIYDSLEISSHYLIGKKGEIIEFLDPAIYIAYHAGCVFSTRFSNPFAVGIEMHNTPSEGHITDLQFESLDWLTRDLLQRFKFDSRYVETHRYAAVYCSTHPLAGRKGRKIDPSGFPDSEFYTWRDSLRTPITGIMHYRVINPRGVYIRQSPQVNDTNIAGVLQYQDIFSSDVLKKDENGEYIKGTNLWAHILKGTSLGQPVDQLGFVHLSNLKSI